VLEDRITPTGGLLDPTFGSGGIVNLPSNTDISARDVAVQPDGKVVIAGEALTSKGNYVATVQRLNPNGTLDTTFNGTGSVTISRADYSLAVALQPDGKILVGGDAPLKQGKTYVDEPLIARLNPNGTLDTTFGSNGLWVSASPNYPVEDLAVLTDPAHPGTVTGIVAAVGGTHFEAVKLTPTGQLDKSFGSGGFALTNISGQALSVAADPLSGEIYLAGFAGYHDIGALAALTPKGVLDTNFSGTGYVQTASTDYYDVVVQPASVNGQSVSRILVGGETWVQSPGSGIVAAYTPTGTLDTTFGNGGSFTQAGLAGGTGAWFNSLVVEADGSIVLGGGQTYGGGYTEMLVGHLTASGGADTSFGQDGPGFTVLQEGNNSSVRGVAIDPTNGDIVAAGEDMDNNGLRHGATLRFTSS